MRIPLRYGTLPQAIAVNATNGRLYVGSADSIQPYVWVYDITGPAAPSFITSIVPGNVVVGLAVNEAKNRVYATTENSGAFEAIDGATNVIMGNIPVTVKGTPRVPADVSGGTAGVNATNGRLYLIGLKVGYSTNIDGSLYFSYSAGSITKALECALDAGGNWVCP